MAEPETVEEEVEAETGEAKTEAKKEEAEVKETVEAEAEKMETEKEEPSTEKAEGDSMAEDPDALPSLQLAWEMIELARLIYKQRSEVNQSSLFDFINLFLLSQRSEMLKYLNVIYVLAKLASKTKATLEQLETYSSVNLFKNNIFLFMIEESLRLIIISALPIRSRSASTMPRKTLKEPETLF